MDIGIHNVTRIEGHLDEYEDESLGKWACLKLKVTGDEILDLNIYLKEDRINYGKALVKTINVLNPIPF